MKCIEKQMVVFTEPIVLVLFVAFASPRIRKQ